MASNLLNPTADNNPSMHLHEVLAAEFTALHGQPAPNGSDLPVPPAKNAEEEKAREAKQQRYLEDIWTAVHALPEKRAALCISGGGIRSATFALGVLQGLARCGLLEKFHYLSTVSGGGYIGSWLTAWIQRADKGLPDVVRDLAKPRADTRPNPEPKEIQNLRSYSNYLSPKLGLLSADTWTLVATYLRNLLLNWLVLIPLLAAALAVPWIYTAILMINPPPDSWVPFVIGAVGLVIGITYMGFNLPSAERKRPRGQKQFLLWCLLPLTVGAFSMTIFWAWFTHYGGEVPEWPFFWGLGGHTSTVFLWTGIGIHVVSWLVTVVRAHGVRFLEFVVVVMAGAIGGGLLWVAAFELFPYPTKYTELYSCFAMPLFLGLFLLSLVAFAGLSSRWTGDEDREWWARANGWLLIVALGWIVLSALVIFGGFALGWAISAVTGLVSGVITALAGRSSKTAASDKQGGKTGIVGWLLSKASSFAALVFICVLAVLVTLALTCLVELIVSKLDVDWDLDAKSATLGAVWHYLNVILYAPWWVISLVAVSVAGFGLVMTSVINPNRFSMHAMYRDRLIRAYLGASNQKRRPNPFTGFDPEDNPKMHEVWAREESGRKLMPVINIALNLVGGENLAWQERKATSFTASPLHCGSFQVGYRRTNAAPGQRYGSDEKVSPDEEPSSNQATTPMYGGREGMSLGTALAISGAAASPNMGYHSSPLVTFILTLLNVRLGAWLGNPGPHGDSTFNLGYPRFGVRPIIAEAFGLTDDTNPYVYLSDGGHFENLGLYEMVLRRCHYIVVSDAGQDPLCSFADLGDAVRKIRIDLGIPIEFVDPISIFARSEEKEQNRRGRVCALGKIKYSAVDGAGIPDGELVYIKPACYGEEPRDIYEYFRNHTAFPHEPTSDQFFSESQFESYRMLGIHSMEKVCPGAVGDFESFLEGVRKYLATSPPKTPETPDEPKNPPSCCD
jgi:Patatin-like phospholipase